jgi:hypothetical protein
MHIPPKALAQPRTFATSKQEPTEAGQPLQFGMIRLGMCGYHLPQEQEVFEQLQKQLSWVPRIRYAEVDQYESEQQPGLIRLQGISPFTRLKITLQLIKQKQAKLSPTGKLIYQFKGQPYVMTFDWATWMR